MHGILFLVVTTCFCFGAYSFRQSTSGLTQRTWDQGSSGFTKSNGCQLKGMVHEEVPPIVVGDYGLKGFNEVSISGGALTAASWIGLSISTRITEWKWKGGCAFQAKIAFSFADTEANKQAVLSLDGVVKSAASSLQLNSEVIRLADESYPAAQFAFIVAEDGVTVSGSNTFVFPDTFMGAEFLGKCKMSILWAEGFFQVGDSSTPHMRFLSLLVQFKKEKGGEEIRYTIHFAHSPTATAPAIIQQKKVNPKTNGLQPLWQMFLKAGNSLRLLRCKQPAEKNAIGTYKYGTNHVASSSITLIIMNWEIQGQCDFGITVQVHVDTFVGRYSSKVVKLSGIGHQVADSDFTFALKNPAEIEYPFVIRSISANVPLKGHVEEVRVQVDWQVSMLRKLTAGPGMLLSAPGKILSTTGRLLPGPGKLLNASGKVLSAPGDLLSDGFLSQAALKYVIDY